TLQINKVVIRGARELRFAAGNEFRGDSQAVAFEDRHPRAVAAERRAAQQIEGPDVRHRPLSHARGADDGALFALHPDMLRRLPVSHELAYFPAHKSSWKFTVRK